MNTLSRILAAVLVAAGAWAQRPAHYQTMQVLSTEVVQLQKSMVMFLDARLQVKGLTASQKQQASRILLRVTGKDEVCRGRQNLEAHLFQPGHHAFAFGNHLAN